MRETRMIKIRSNGDAADSIRILKEPKEAVHSVLRGKGGECTGAREGVVVSRVKVIYERQVAL